MATVTIDAENRDLEAIADELGDEIAGLGPEEVLKVTLENVGHPRTAIGFIDGAIDAGEEVLVHEIRAEDTGTPSILEMMQNEEQVHVEELVVEIRP